MRKTIGEDVGRRIEELAAQINAATAELVQLSAEYDDVGGWFGVGLRSCAHWLSIHTGVDAWTGAEMVRTGHALRELPRIAEAFAEGRLSLDKVRKVTRVAVPDDEEVWLEVALNASGGQLSRIAARSRAPWTQRTRTLRIARSSGAACRCGGATMACSR